MYKFVNKDIPTFKEVLSMMNSGRSGIKFIKVNI